MKLQILGILIGFLISNSTLALTFPIFKGSDIIGGIQTAIVQKGESLSDIGRRFDLGLYEMIEANPNIDPWKPVVGAKVIIPSQFILPEGARKGMVINLAEMRLYFYHADSNLVSTYPVGIGRKGWATPLTSTSIAHKQKHPSWTPPASIRAEAARRGKILPGVVPPGPNNPLGDYAMKLSLAGYLIHGTNKPGGIGVRSSSGCIRMFPEDIEALFYMVDVGTSVKIIHNPFKFGRHGSQLYMEAHEPLSERKYGVSSTNEYIAETLLQLPTTMPYRINWEKTEQKMKKPIGYPVLVDYDR